MTSVLAVKDKRETSGLPLVSNVVYRLLASHYSKRELRKAKQKGLLKGASGLYPVGISSLAKGQTNSLCLFSLCL